MINHAMQMQLTGWGLTSTATSHVYRPERQSQLLEIIQRQHPTGIIPYAAGCSYGDQALNDQGECLMTQSLNRIISFNPDSGECVCEAGVTFKDLIDTFLPQHWLPPVIPGTMHATIGGAVANDVHGKNHQAGSFSHHVRWLSLINQQGHWQQLTPNDPLFKATVAGMGLTGLMTHVCFTLIPTHNSVAVNHHFTHDLDQMLQCLTDSKHDFAVGWLDGLQYGLGRGVFSSGELADQHLSLSQTQYRMPGLLPFSVINRYSQQLINQCYLSTLPKKTKIQSIPEFLNPLDKIEHWNYAYGKRGFFQIQVVFPSQQAREGIVALLSALQSQQFAASLIVIKQLGQKGLGLLSFTEPGITMALDFPYHEKFVATWPSLEALMIKHHGKVYLAKDNLLSREGFNSMYANVNQFQALIKGSGFQSNMSRRLGLED